MSRLESIAIREVEPSDVEIFYHHQPDPKAIRMAAFVFKDPKDKVAFDAHLEKILNSSQNINRTMLHRDGKNKDFANGRGEDTEEYILRLDPDQATE